MVEYHELMEVAEVITKEVMEQYEEIRAASPCNMWDRRCVQLEADSFDYHALASLTKSEYVLIMKHYSDLMVFHNVERQQPANPNRGKKPLEPQGEG